MYKIIEDGDIEVELTGEESIEEIVDKFIKNKAILQTPTLPGIPSFVQKDRKIKNRVIRESMSNLLRGYDRKEHTIGFSSPIPLLSGQAKKDIKQAEINFLEILLSAFKEPIIGDRLIGRHIDENKYSLHTRVCWMPSPQDLHIDVETVDKDPFVIGYIRGKPFLITKWVVENEEPFEHYLQEYSMKKSGGNYGRKRD